MRFLWIIVLVLAFPAVALADEENGLDEAIEAAQDGVDDALLPDDDDENDVDGDAAPAPMKPLAGFRHDSEKIAAAERVSTKAANQRIDVAQDIAEKISGDENTREREEEEVKLETVARRTEDSTGGAETEVGVIQDFADLDVYGRFALHIRNDKDELTIRNNSSRFGLEPLVHIGKFVVKGRGEWRINFGVGDEEFNLDTGDIDSSASPLSTRLGYVGFSAGEYGEVYFGKQWSVFYDISAWTDQFTVFGGGAAGAFNAGTDGGALGTGRVDSAVTYRFNHKGVEFGMQGQFTNGRQRFLDGFAVALAYKLDFGLAAGVAYNHAFLNTVSTSLIEGHDDKDAQILNAAIKYKRRQFYIAALFAVANNTEIVKVGDQRVTYRTKGAELFAEYAFKFGLSAYGGMNFSEWTADSDLLSDDAGVLDFMVGAKYNIGEFVFLYSEGRISASRDAVGVIQPSVATLGLRLDYSLIKFRATR